MAKKIGTIILMLLMLLSPAAAWADVGDVETLVLTEHNLGSDVMHISLPEGWYFNTPRDIDGEFLKVSENSRRKLIKYLNDSDIDYNLVSKDLLDEINIIFVNSSQSKMMYNFSLLNRDVLIERAKSMVDMGTQENKDIRSTYHSYELQEFNGCIFMVFEGTMESPEEKVDFYQYTTMVNGFGITFTYRGSEGTDYESGKLLLDKIAHSFTVDEIKEADLKENMIKQMIAPAALVAGFIGFTIFLFIRQLRKNKKEEKAKLNK